MGSLLVALSGGDHAQVERTLGQTPASTPRTEGASASNVPDVTPQRAPASGYPPPRGRPAPQPVRAGAPRTHGAPSDLPDEVEFVLADARERAQAIIDESAERARELIREERVSSGAVGGIDPGAFEDLRRGLRGLVTEVRDIQQRLGRIEQLLRDQTDRGATSASTAPATPAPTWPVYEPPRTVEADPVSAWRTPEASDEVIAEPEAPEEYEPSEPASFEAYQPNEAPPEEPAEEDAAEDLDAPPHAPAPPPVPPRSSFSVVPPQRREWPAAEPALDEPDVPAVPERPEAVPPPAPPRTYGRAEPAAEIAPTPESWPASTPLHSGGGGMTTGAPLATFLPSDGAITLRVTPVAGFQGLMRIQDALTRLPVVRQASVEAYSQGEARLRIELADASDSDELAADLGRALNSPARVEDASEVHRELLITLR